MLVLSRRIGESVVLPSCEVTLTVVAVHGNRVRLGITAPRGLAVHRTEIWARIAREEDSRNGGPGQTAETAGGR